MLKRFSFLIILATLLLSLSYLFACASDDDDDDDDSDDSDDSDDDAGSDSCTAEAMCQFSVDCALGYDSVEDCVEASEAAIETCGDASGYGDCVCDCYLADPSCAEYLNCGMSCYSEFC